MDFYIRSFSFFCKDGIEKMGMSKAMDDREKKLFVIDG